MTEHGMVAGDSHITGRLSWVKVRSWHIEATGRTRTVTRCGLRVAAHPSQGEHQAAQWRFDAPLRDEKTCETCLRSLAERPRP